MVPVADQQQPGPKAKPARPRPSNLIAVDDEDKDCRPSVPVSLSTAPHNALASPCDASVSSVSSSLSSEFGFDDDGEPVGDISHEELGVKAASPALQREIIYPHRTSGNVAGASKKAEMGDTLVVFYQSRASAHDSSSKWKIKLRSARRSVLQIAAIVLLVGCISVAIAVVLSGGAASDGGDSGLAPGRLAFTSAEPLDGLSQYLPFTFTGPDFIERTCNMDELAKETSWVGSADDSTQLWPVGINWEGFTQPLVCGMCIAATGYSTHSAAPEEDAFPTDRVRYGIVVSDCPDCAAPGDLRWHLPEDESSSSDSFDVKWYPVQCPVVGALQFTSEGSSPWLLRVQVGNSKVPIASVSASVGGNGFKKLLAAEDNFWIWSGPGTVPHMQPISLQIVSVLGDEVTDTVSFNLEVDRHVVRGSAQFPDGGTHRMALNSQNPLPTAEGVTAMISPGNAVLGEECSLLWQQCGGEQFTGATCCSAGSVCTYDSESYSQCLPAVGEASTVIATPAPSSSSASTPAPTPVPKAVSTAAPSPAPAVALAPVLPTPVPTPVLPIPTPTPVPTLAPTPVLPTPVPSSTSAPTPAPTPVPASPACGKSWSQCGGVNYDNSPWTGTTCCQEGLECTFVASSFSQCRPISP
jgi:hypothetical protein